MKEESPFVNTQVDNTLDTRFDGNEQIERRFVVIPGRTAAPEWS
jgi:hypothetical protein